MEKECGSICQILNCWQERSVKQNPSSTVKNERQRQRREERGGEGGREGERDRDRETERSERQQTLTSCISISESRWQSSKAGANICEGETGRLVTPYSDPRKLANRFLYSWTHWLPDTTRLPLLQDLEWITSGNARPKSKEELTVSIHFPTVSREEKF